jgi:hypothetical protein
MENFIRYLVTWSRMTQNSSSMTHEKFMEIFDILEQDITEQNTTFRESIGPTERLAVCLR